MMQQKDNNNCDGSSISSFDDEKQFECMETGSMLECDNEDEKEEEECLAQSVAKQDSKSAARCKVIVIVLLCINASIIIFSTYLFLLRQEEEKFADAFTAIAQKVIDAVEYNASSVETTFHSFGEALTSFWQATQNNPPFATIPNFDSSWGSNLKTQTSVELVGVAPLVRNEPEKTLWEEFARENPWYMEELDSNKTTSTAEQARKAEGIAPKVYVLEEHGGGLIPQPQQGPGPYAPVWQLHPYQANKEMIKFDLLSDPIPQRMYEEVVESKHPATSPFMNIDLFMVEREGSDSPSTLQPRSLYFQPVHNHSQTTKENNGGDRALDAILFGVMNWEVFFSDILEDPKHKIFAVLENDCYESGQNFTFQIEGPKVNPLGPGDLHEGLDQVALTADLMPMAHADNECMYKVSIFPSKSLQATFQSDLPMIVSSLVASMFFVTACAFMVYTTYIQKRQKQLLNIATHTTSIVSGLFPPKMRDRILKEAEDQAFKALVDKQQAGSGKKTRRPSGHTSISSGDYNFKIEEHLIKASGHMRSASSRPVAEVFHETTVFFGDIVGFTQWSAMRGRDPTEVFHLLEVLYGAYDILAARRKVYKIETVGDCYVAVTGVPEANQNHALAMALFASECMAVLPRILASLEKSLGPETRNLNMRIGLHSGPVTGGVLRGERGRFQLFGDTMNTTSRIEHGGAPGRIHLSQEIADLLKAAGKGDWVVPREDKIFAKGKGHLSTYWFERPFMPTDTSIASISTTPSSPPCSSTSPSAA